MTIIPQQPQVPANPQAVLARTLLAVMAELGLNPGRPALATVIGPLPDGSTQLQLGDRMLKLALPQTLLPGTQISLAVDTAPEQPVITVTLADPRMPPAAVRATPAPVPAPLPTPVTSAMPAPPQQPPVAALPAAQTLPAAQVPPDLRALIATAPVMPAPPPSVTGTANTPQPPSMCPDVSARVVAVTPEGITRLAIGEKTIELRLPAPLPVGTTVRIAPQMPGPVVAASPLVVTPVSMPPMPVVSLPAQSTPAALPSAPAVPGAPANMQSQTAVPPGTGPSVPLAPSPAGQTLAPIPPLPPGGKPVVATPPITTAPPATPVAAAVREAVQQAIGPQQSIAPLLVTLANLGGRLGQLPVPVAQAAMQLLANRVPVDRPLTAERLQAAVAKSGVFLEAGLTLPNPAGAAKGDTKASLLTLRNGLLALFGAAGAPVESVKKAPPPLRGVPPRQQASDLPMPLPESREATGKQVLQQAESALHRMRLSQLASLPDAPPGVSQADKAGEWNLEIPLLLGRELAMLGLQIHRDARNKNAKAGRGWQMRFALNFSALGEVGANVALRDGVTNVLIWADDPETADTLNAMLPNLTAALGAHGLTLGSVLCRSGAPREAGIASGRLVDAQS